MKKEKKKCTEALSTIKILTKTQKHSSEQDKLEYIFYGLNSNAPCIIQYYV